MRWIVILYLMVVLFSVAGCSTMSPAPVKKEAVYSNGPESGLSGTNKPSGKLIVTPAIVHNGTVVRVNRISRFVVLSFPTGVVPPVDSQLNVYRTGLKVAELKVTGPQKGENTVADVTAGEVIVGDEIRGD